MTLPNTISGDGRTFVAALKRYLESINTQITPPSDKVVGTITEINVDERNRQIGYNLVRNDLGVSWNVNGVQSYAYSKVYVKHTRGSWDEVEGTWGENNTAFEQLTTPYTYVGNGVNNFLIEDAITDATYWIKVVAVNLHNQEEELEIANSVSYRVVGKQYVPSPPSGLGVTFDKRGIIWKWDKTDDRDLDYYELREDNKTGVETFLLEKTRYEYSTALPSSRSGTVYLYTRNSAGRYCDAPATLQYNKPVPSAPGAVTLTSIFQGVRIDFSPIPDTCTGANITINGEKFFTPNNSFAYNIQSGTLVVKVCFVDIFGEGVYSEESTLNVVEKIDGQMLANEAVSLANVNVVLQDAIAQAQQSVSTATYLQGISNLQAQIDGQVMNWFYDYDPTLLNEPAVSWTTTAEKDNHLGDLFYNTVAGTSFRFAKVSGAYTWMTVNDTGVAAAMEAAKRAQDTADHKRRIFVSEPVPPYDAGDLWTQGAGGDIKRCVTARLTGDVYRAIDWELAGKYTDDSALTNFISTTYTSNNSNMQSQITANANGITGIVTGLNGNPATSSYSAIKQTNDAIVSVVNELNKPLDQCSYTAVTQTKNAINLRAVKTDVDNALAGKTNNATIISQINVSPEVITIAGNKIHVTGETVFDDSIIVSRMIGDQEVVGTKIKDGVVSTDKLMANAVTTGKLAANAVTAEKIAAGVINANHIVSGSLPLGVLDTSTQGYIGGINTTATNAQNVLNLWKYPSTTYIHGGQVYTGSITANQLAVNSVTAEKIASGSITADKIATGSINAGHIISGSLSLSSLNTDTQNLINTASTTASAANTAATSAQNNVNLWKYADSTYINGGQIYTGSITANKLSVSSLSAISGTIGTLRTATTGARTEIKDNLIEVYDANNVLRVRMGVW